MKKLIIIFIAALAIAGGGFALYYFNNYETTLYTKVDNSKLHRIGEKKHPDDLDYEYALPCYNEKGHEKTCQFKTNRELREGAYLSLSVRSLGVHSWAEIPYEDLPEKVQSKL